MNKILLIIFLTFNTVVINSAFADGNELLEKCSKVHMDSKDFIGKDYQQAAFCLGLMQGITNMSQSFAKQLKPFICLPKAGITNGQAVRIVVKYLEDHPQVLHENETELAIAAFMDAYPCNK